MCWWLDLTSLSFFFQSKPPQLNLVCVCWFSQRLFMYHGSLRQKLYNSYIKLYKLKSIPLDNLSLVEDWAGYISLFLFVIRLFFLLIVGLFSDRSRLGVRYPALSTHVWRLKKDWSNTWAPISWIKALNYEQEDVSSLFCCCRSSEVGL